MIAWGHTWAFLKSSKNTVIMRLIWERQGRIGSIMRPNSYLRGQHSQAHASLMPHRGAIWWKNAKRLLECDPVLQALTYFDMFWCLLAAHARQTPIYCLFGSGIGLRPGPFFSASAAKKSRVPPLWHIFPPKGHAAGLLRAPGWGTGTLGPQYTKRETGGC